MKKYKTMDEWYQDWLEGNTLLKRTKIHSDTYKAKVEKKLLDPLNISKLEVARKRYSLFQVKSETLASWDEERKRAYYQRELYLITGKYDRLRFNQWKTGYIERMKELGMSKRLINKFIKEVTYRNRAIIDLLPNIAVLYVASGASLQEASDYEDEQARQIRRALNNF